MSLKLFPRAGVVILAFAVALVIAACGDDDSSSDSDASASADTASGDVPSWCGPDEITLALADGFGDNNWRKITTAEAEDEAAKCPSVTEFTYTDGQGDTQKAISDIQGLVAQGVDAMVVFPDAGEAVLPAIRSAYQAGVTTVPYRVSPGGEPGVDYDYFIETDFTDAGRLWGEWLVEHVFKDGEGGTVLTLGGPPANSQSLDEYEGMAEVLNDYPEIELLGEQPYTPTNWDAAKTQQVVTAALAKYPKIDAITTDFGSALASAFPAFEQANREIPAVATEDSNLLSCEREKIAKQDGYEFPLFTQSSQNWMVRTAVQFAVADASGGEVPESTEVPREEFENSFTNEPNPPTCKPELGDEAILSTKLTDAQLTEALAD
jgi:ribose transport system substrate-binding protein